MDRRALEKAKSRIRVANNAIADLRNSESYKEFADNWYVFIFSAKSVYTVLEQGAKTSPQSLQWFGSKKQVRKNDQLLQYLYEARNDDEHGLGSSVELKPEKHEIGVSEPGFSNAVRLDGGSFSNVIVSNFNTAVKFEGLSPPPELRITPLDNKPVLVKYSPATAILVDVKARGNRCYSPPTSHLGNPIKDKSPVAVAKLAISYLEGLLTEASDLV